MSDFDLIYPRGRMWHKLRLPPFPPSSAILPALPLGIENELPQALDIVSLIKKKDGSRRSIGGVNRAAQLRWPERRIYIDFVSSILMAWQLAGMDALVELVRNEKEDRDGKLVFKSDVGNCVNQVAASLQEPARGSEVFVAIDAIVGLRDDPNLLIPIYLVSTVARFGRYQFHLASHKIPSSADVGIYCVWHTRIAPHFHNAT